MAAAPAAERQPVRQVVPAEREARVIVSLKADTELLRRRALSVADTGATVAEVARQRAALLGARHGLQLVAGRVVSAHAQVVRAAGMDSDTLARQLATDADVAWAVPDRRRRIVAAPGDPLYATGPASGLGPDVGQWYLRMPDATIRSAVNAQGAWDFVTGSSGIVVAVLDTGIRAEHPDLAGVVLSGYDMVNDGDTANDGGLRDADASDPGDWITDDEDRSATGPFGGCGASASSWHGTQVSGIVGAVADNGIGMAGVAHGVRILPVRVMGKCGGYDSDIVAGIRWAAGLSVPGVPLNPHPARVINMSLGGAGSCSAAYRSAIVEVRAPPHLVTVVAAAGNSTGHAVSTPANCAGVIAVTGLRHAGSKVGFSDLGPEITIAAPGGNCVNITDGSRCLYPILTTANSGVQGPDPGGSIWTDSYNASFGTSFATPIVAGTAALMLSARPTLTPTEVSDALKATARPFPTSGADNGPDDPSPVQQCRAPDGTDQLQCYCRVGLCGAGMLDAAAAVANVAQPVSLAEGARRLLDLAQQTYPELFPGNAITQTSAPFLYRHYPATGTYLGVVVQSDPAYTLNGVYVMGGPFPSTPVLVGRVQDFVNLGVAAASAARAP